MAKNILLQARLYLLILLALTIFAANTGLANDSVAQSIKEAIQDKDVTISYGSNNAEQSIYVFSSLDCPHCVRFHKQVPEIIKSETVKVIYIPLPIRPRNSPSYQKMAAIWGLPANERAAALDLAFADPNAFELVSSFDLPLQLGQGLANQLGISGTPTIVFPDSRMHSGYASANQVLRYLSSIQQ